MTMTPFPTQPVSPRDNPTESRSPRRVVMRAANLRKSFGGQKVLADVTCELREGECVALIGVNGSGKTTLENILSGSLEPDAGQIELRTNGSTERFDFPRSFWQAANPLDHFAPERLARLGVVKTWQDVRLFPGHTLADNISVAAPDQLGENPLGAIFRRHAVRKQEASIGQASQKTLERLGLGDRAGSSGDRISLGQAKRIAIARAVTSGARILYLDEPLSGLDAIGVQEVMGLLQELVHEQKLTLVIIEHAFNLPCVLNLATKVWTLSEGKLHEESTVSFLSRPANGSPAGLEESLRTAGTQSQAADVPLPGGAILVRHRRKDFDPARPILEVQDLVVFRGQRLVLGERSAEGSIRGLSFSLYHGEIACLKAPNGWGKTTLLETIAGLQRAERGSIKINGRRVEALEPWTRAQLGIFLLQARNHSFASLTVRESLQLATVATVPESLHPLLNRHVSDLSGGERQRLALTSVLEGADRTESLGLLDEPFGFLDHAALADQKLWGGLTRCGAALIAIPLSPPASTAADK